jgi:tRNA G46 methylase TrmB
MVKTGNLFELAERELQREGKIYTISDIIDYAVKMRKWLDEKKNINKFLKEERRLRHNQANKRFRLKKEE